MSNIINKSEIEEDRVIEFLTNFDVEFVSLVDHASMRAPFKIIRSENISDCKGKSMLNVIQSVLVPSNIDLSVLRAEQPWLSKLNTEKVDEFDYYKKYNQLDVDKFKDGSLRIERLEGGALVLVGEAEEVSDSTLIMRDQQTVSVEPSSFKQLVLSEVDAMLSTVFGSLEMREMPVKDKKRAITSALDAFKTYVGISLDHLGNNTEVRFDDTKWSLSKKIEGDIAMTDEVRQEAVSETATAPLFNIDGDTIGKIVEERAQKVFEQHGIEITNRLEKFLAALTPPKEEVKEEQRAEEPPTATVTVELTDELRSEIKRLEERLAKFEAEDSELSGRSSEVEDKDTIARASQPSESNIWQGLFFKN